MLETLQHTENSFVTLTYADNFIPNGNTLKPLDITRWLKRIRKHHPTPLRYYAVGEYGDVTQRPHYHVALFGYPPCEYGQTRRNLSRNRICCSSCAAIEKTWGMGRTDLGRLETHSAQYVAGYVTKKMTKADDPRLEGRHPEFARMSLKPGIGGDAVHEIVSIHLQYQPDALEVPTALRHGTQMLPLGRYLTRRIRKYAGRDEGPSLSTTILQQEKLRDVSEAAELSPALKKETFKSMVLEKYDKKVKAKEAKHRVYNKGNRSKI